MSDPHIAAPTRGSRDPYRTSWVDDGRMADAMLVRRTLAGDRRAFTALVDRHSMVCLRYATRMLGDPADAEDVVQQTWVRAHRELHTYECSRPFRIWLMVILVNRCRSAMLLRRRRRDEPSGALERALEGLDAAQREAFLLKHVERLSHDEIATVTGTGASVLRLRARRACERLRKLLAQQETA